MKNPGQPRQRTNSFKNLVWDKGRSIIRLRTFNDLMREIYTDDLVKTLIPPASPWEALLKGIK